MSVCSPNHLHDAHIRLALRLGADAICEKPLVINPWNLDALQELENETGKRIYTILQLRVHPSIIEIKKKIDKAGKDKKYNIKLSYITSRGPWYRYSWKCNEEKSGGLATNIGIHFFDMLMWLFGNAKSCSVGINQKDKMSGNIELEKADIDWFLSINKNDLPKSVVENGIPTHRSITIDGEEIEFTDGFADLHTKIYEQTLNGNGFGIEDIRQAIELVHEIRHAGKGARVVES